MQPGNSTFASDATRAGASAPYFIPNAGTLQSVTVDGTLDVSGLALFRSNITVDGIIALPGTLNGISSNGTTGNLLIAADNNISLATTTGSVFIDSFLTIAPLQAREIQLFGTGQITIPSGANTFTLPVSGMSGATGRVIASISGAFNNAGAIAATAASNGIVFTTSGNVSADTFINFVITHL
jgi:hypothetical protein